ncbi:hypothetical protein BBP40_004615 [Aspergillus hancockii]|nr:hypothetical protein BBP40_004615 [Aspergillus hancockii]
MVLLSSLAVIAALASLGNGQTASTIDPNSVPLSTREQWCQSQKAACPLICLQLPGASGSPNENTCDPSDCRSKNPCGAQDPKRVNKTTSTATSTPAATTSLPPFTGVPDKDNAATKQSADLSHIYGLAVVMTGFFAGFATLL